MASRGMGAINPSKMPKGKKVVRKDNPNDVEVYKRGGKVTKKIKALSGFKGFKGYK